MKIRNILAISLATSSFSCLAFKSSPNVLPGPTNQLTAVESKIIGHFYAPHSTLPGTTITGTCDASPSRDAPVRFVLCCVAKTDNIRIYLVFHDEFTQRLIEEGKMVSKSKAHCRRMLQALQQTRAGIFDQLENCQHTLPEYIAISSETSATLIHRVPPEKRRNEQ